MSGLIRCRQLNPCFPHRVVRSMSQRDRRLYVLFHACLWTGVLTFVVGTGLYAALQTYAFFIMALPCVCVMFVGQFGFRWLAIRNEDKFEMFYPSGRGGGDTGGGGSESAAEGARHPWELQRCDHLGPPPPPVYSAVYEGPIFTIDGALAPPPEYEYIECQQTPVPKSEGDEEGGAP